MADKSWGEPTTALWPPRDRATARADRATARIDAIAARSEARAAARDAAAAEREQSRQDRREAEERLAVGDPHAAAAQRRRGSGRKDVVRDQRDTRGYAVVVDEARIRVLAQRGASVAGLAAVFGLGTDEIERVLAAEP